MPGFHAADLDTANERILVLRKPPVVIRVAVTHLYVALLVRPDRIREQRTRAAMSADADATVYSRAGVSAGTRVTRRSATARRPAFACSTLTPGGTSPTGVGRAGS